MSEMKYTIKDYRSGLKPIWCPGCGDFGVLNSLYQALSQLQVPPHEMALISGIGCSSRLPGYVHTYGFNAVHGRVLPIATGAKMANPAITVIGVGGDGDGFSIGSGHNPHAARKNVDITYIVMNNSIYGLTKGQASPTTPLGEKTKTTAYGNAESPINPIRMMLSYHASFVARVFSGHPKETAEIFAKAIAHKGFAFVEALSPCPTFRGREQFDLIKENSSYLDDDYEPTDLVKAWELADHAKYGFKLGIFYNVPRMTYTEAVESIQEKARATGVPEPMELLNIFAP